MMRRSVVLPEPDGPSNATSSPEGIFRADIVERGKLPEFLRDMFRFDAHAICPSPFQRRGFRQLTPRSPFDNSLDQQGGQSQQGQQGRHRECGRELVFVVKNFDVQRHGIGASANMAGDHRHRAELAHGAGIAQDHAIEQSPFDVGQAHAEKSLPAAGAESQRGFFFLLPLRLQQGNQFAGNKGKSHEDSGQNDSRHRKNI